MLKTTRARGLSLLELAVAMLIFVILVAVVLLAVRGIFGSASKSALDVDLANMQKGVDAYCLKSPQGTWPTADRRLPAQGEYALIDFSASYDVDGLALSLYPHFIAKLPRHWDQGVWRIDSAGLVSVGMDRDDY